jgi:hypothetical protein
MKKLALGVMAVVAGGMVVAGGVLATAAAGHSTSRRGGFMELRVALTKQALRDLPPKGNSAGDLLVDKGRLTHNGKPDGYGHEVCVVTFPVSKTRLEFQCNEVLDLRSGGTLTAQGVLALNFSKGGPQPTTYAITGGTGRYSRARGQITTKSVGAQEVWKIRLAS